MARFNTSKKFVDSRITDFSEDIRKKLSAGLKEKKGCYIYGPVGTGKTHLSNALFHHATENFKGNIDFFNFSELLYSIKSKYSDKQGTNYLDKLIFEKQEIKIDGTVEQESRLLILDDIGSEKNTDWVIETLFLIINRIYESEGYLIITSNLDIAEFSEKYGDRITSRVLEMCELIKLDGKDLRIEK